MAITATHPHSHVHHAEEHEQRLVSRRITRYAVPVGRVLFVMLFLLSVPVHFSQQGIAYAGAQGVPMPSITVPLTGLMALIGGLSVAFGYRARVGAFLLVLFLLPVTLMMHNFWMIADPEQAMLQRVMFYKNLSMLGGALLLTHFGAGPLSVDARIYKARSEQERREHPIHI